MAGCSSACQDMVRILRPARDTAFRLPYPRVQVANQCLSLIIHSLGSTALNSAELANFIEFRQIYLLLFILKMPRNNRFHAVKFDFKKKQHRPSPRRVAPMQDVPSAAPFAGLLLQRETDTVQLPARLAQGEGLINWADRDRESQWICQSSRRLGLDSDSVTSAIAILDRVVCSTRVPPKYLNCVAAACLHIAKKLHEDHEETTSNFLDQLRLAYSDNEMKRMEMRILTLLNWDVQLPTISRFLESILTPLGATYLISPLRCHIEAVVCSSYIMSEFRPSLISLAIISLVLEASKKQWLQPIQHLIKPFKVDVSDLIRCRERVSSLWSRSLIAGLSSYGLLGSQDAVMSDELFVEAGYGQTESNIYSTSMHITSPTSPLPISSPPFQPTPC